MGGGGSSSVHRDLAWEPEGRWFKSQPGPKNMERGLVAGEVPVHLLGTAEVALEQGTEPPQPLRTPVHGQTPHSDISPFNACIGPVCACVCVFRTCVYM